jgi:hypothetical protein
MDFHYDIKDEKLKRMVENKAQELGISVDELIWGYINRGLMSDNLNEEVFNENHSSDFLNEVDEALGIG